MTPLQTDHIPIDIAWKAFIKVNGGKAEEITEALKNTRFSRHRHTEGAFVADEELKYLVELVNAYKEKKGKKTGKIKSDRLVNIANRLLVNMTLSEARRMTKESEKKSRAIERAQRLLGEKEKNEKEKGKKKGSNWKIAA